MNEMKWNEWNMCGMPQLYALNSSTVTCQCTCPQLKDKQSMNESSSRAITENWF